MKDADISALIKKAKESLGAAEQLLKSGYPDFSASRSYYAMFYAVQALLLTKNLTFFKHSQSFRLLVRNSIKVAYFLLLCIATFQRHLIRDKQGTMAPWAL